MPRPVTRLGTVVVIALALFAALPAAVMAQGSGDEQYADPFGELPEAQAPPEQPAPAEPSPPDAIDPTAAAPELSAIEPGPESAASVDAVGTATGGELARTGLPARLLLATGLTLLGTGMLLHLAAERPQASRPRR